MNPHLHCADFAVEQARDLFVLEFLKSAQQQHFAFFFRQHEQSFVQERCLLFAVFALAVVVQAASAASTVRPLTQAQRLAVIKVGAYHSGCPVLLSQLRVLTVRHWGFDGRAQSGQLVVNEKYAPALEMVFGKLFAMRFPIRHMRFSDTYGGPYPKDGPKGVPGQVMYDALRLEVDADAAAPREPGKP